MFNATLQPLYPRERDPYPFYRRLDGSQDRSGLVRKISPPPEFDSRTVKPVPSQYTDYAIPAHFQGRNPQLCRTFCITQNRQLPAFLRDCIFLQLMCSDRLRCHVHTGHGELYVGGSRSRSVQPPHLHLRRTLNGSARVKICMSALPETSLMAGCLNIRAQSSFNFISVGTAARVRAGHFRSRGSISGKDTNFTFSPKRPDRLWSPPR